VTWRTVVFGGLLLVLTPQWASAATCTIATTPLAFGLYDVFAAAATDSTGTLTFRCSGPGNSAGNRIAVTVGVSRGSSATFAPRTLLAGTATLGYNVFRDAARTAVWGDGSSGTQVYTNGNVPRNTDIRLTLFGRIPPLQDAQAGAYTDTLTVTINF
jgi:spore coat protein U-like protein